MLAKKIIRLFAVLVLSGVSSIAFSETFTFSDALELMDENGHVTISDNYTEIGQNAFNSTAVVSVTIPSTVSSIGNYAFANTPKLEEIVIPDSITSIPDYAFKESGLSRVTLHSNISNIGADAFHSTKITEVNLPENIIIGNGAFQGAKLKHIRLPNGTRLNSYSFALLGDSLISLEIGENVSMQTSTSIFEGSGNNLKTIVSSSPIGCQNKWYGICPGLSSNLDKLEFLVFKGSQNTSHRENISHSGAKIVLQYGSSAAISHSLVSSEVIVVSPTVVFGPINSSPHSYCSGVDADEDGFPDCYDQFPNDPDRWFDYGDGSNDVPQLPSNDTDGDGVLDIFDQFYGSHDHIDTDGDGISNGDDKDDDNDGLLDVYETGFPFNYDITVDGLLSGFQFGTNPLNPDSDFDGILDGLDAFPLDNTESLDTDSDGIGNNADSDDDGDGHFDLLDAFPLDASEWMDSDLDGIGNNADTDDDNDGVLDDEDAFPFTASESVDTDGDGVGDNSDAFPNDSSETLDTDLDGIGNNADTDDDNDGVADAEDSDPLNDAIGALESQNLFVMGNPVAVNGYLTTISVGYDVSDDNNQLTGIGFRVHYDSSIYSYSAVESTINESLIVDGMGPYQDIEDLDNDSTTDSYIVFGWAAVNTDWPNIELPAKLTDIQLFVNWDDYDAGSTTSNINFSIVDNAEGYEAKTTDYAMTVLPATWDFDGNGSADALTDGLMLLRYTFGIRDLRMASGAMAQNSMLSATQVVDNMHRAATLADIDGNGSTDALTDGLILLRYLFGLRGEILITGAISSDATRTTKDQIEQYLSLYMPSGLTLPVQSEQNFMVGDWKLASVPDVREYNWEGVLTDWNTYPWDFTQAIFENCVQDDIYRFGSNGTFEYLINGSTYLDYEINPLYDESDEGFCAAPFAPWNEDEIYTYSVDENDGELTVNGFGAFIVLAHVANGTSDIETPAEAPESITYQYSKISEEQILVEIDAFDKFYRFTLERVPSN